MASPSSFSKTNKVSTDLEDSDDPFALDSQSESDSESESDSDSDLHSDQDSDGSDLVDDFELEHRMKQTPQSAIKSNDDQTANTLSSIQSLISKSSSSSFTFKNFQHLVKLFSIASKLNSSSSIEPNPKRKKTRAAIYQANIESLLLNDKLFHSVVAATCDSFFNTVGKALHLPNLGTKPVSTQLIANSPNSEEGNFVKQQRQLALSIASQSNWKSVKHTVRLFFKSCLGFLTTSSFDPQLYTCIAESVKNSCLYLTHLPKLAKRLLYICVDHWTTVESLKMKARMYSIIRTMSLVLPFPFIDICIKRSFLGYSSTLGSISEHTETSRSFLHDCLLDLFQLDLHSTFQYGFKSVQKLASILRTVLVNGKAKEDTNKIYSWRFLAILQLWLDLLAMTCPNQQLDNLIYPTVQVSLGVLQFSQSPRLAPFTFHILESLLPLVKKTKTFVPLFQVVLPMLTSPIFLRPTKSSGLEPFDWKNKFRASDQQILTKNFQKTMFEKTCLMIDTLAFQTYRNQFGLVEILTPVVSYLRKTIKQTTITPFKTTLVDLTNRIQALLSTLAKQRQSVTFAPKDLDEIQLWTQNNMQQQQVTSVI